jgi:hypothetical protein
MANRKSKAVAVFKFLSSSRRLRDIQVNGLESMRDLTSCPDTRRLYIADPVGKSIWRLAVDCQGAAAEPEPARWIRTPHYRPWTLSMTASAPRRLLVVSGNDNRLFEYGQDEPDTTALEVRLPDWMRPHHAAKTTRQTFVVCHRTESASASNDAHKHYQVSEVDATGCLVRTFGESNGNGHGRLNNPSHVVWDPSGDNNQEPGERDHVIVADSGNCRLLVLTGDLRPERDWPVEVQRSAAKPVRLHLVSSRGQLIVGLGDSNCFLIYSIK